MNDITRVFELRAGIHTTLTDGAVMLGIPSPAPSYTPEIQSNLVALL